MPNASTMSDSPLTQPSANAKPRPIWERYGKLRPNPSQSPTQPSSVIITDSRGSLPILTDSADPRHPTDFTDTTCSVLWAEPHIPHKPTQHPSTPIRLTYICMNIHTHTHIYEHNTVAHHSTTAPSNHPTTITAPTRVIHTTLSHSHIYII